MGVGIAVGDDLGQCVHPQVAEGRRGGHQSVHKQQVLVRDQA